MDAFDQTDRALTPRPVVLVVIYGAGTYLILYRYRTIRTEHGVKTWGNTWFLGPSWVLIAVVWYGMAPAIAQ